MLRHALLGAALLVAGTQGAVGQDARPPHIVLILADDLGIGDPRCYAPESKIPTPAIDRLAAEGVRFTDAHSASSVCTPTRYSILTGRYAWRTPLQRGVLWPWDPPLIEDARVTLPELLRAVGYRTACIGKWHLGWDWPLGHDRWVTDECAGHTWDAEDREAIGARVRFDRPIRGGPLAHGFDHYFGDDVPNFPPYAFLDDEHVTVLPTAQKPARMFGHAGPAAPGWDLAVVLPTLAQRAATWIDERARADQDPFFLYLPLTAPHTPIAPTPRFRAASEAGDYGDYVCEVDWVVGEVLAALDRNGIAERTLVVFTSDNGSPARDGTGMSGPVGSVTERYGHRPSGPWRGLKGDAWEGGHRVPFLVRWPGQAPPGRTTGEPLVSTDLYRTLAAIAGCEVADGEAEDSLDLRSAFRAESGDQPIGRVLVHHSIRGVFAIREGRFKLILGRDSGGFSKWQPPADAPEGQLYDLLEDPAESRNLYAERTDVVEHLRACLVAIRGGRQE